MSSGRAASSLDINRFYRLKEQFTNAAQDLRIGPINFQSDLDTRARTIISVLNDMRPHFGQKTAGCVQGKKFETWENTAGKAVSDA